MRKNRVSEVVAILVLVMALVYLIVGLVFAGNIGSKALGTGWGPGWTGWASIPLVVTAIFSSVTLMVFGLVLLFLTKIDGNLAVARQRRQEAHDRAVATRAAQAVAVPVAAAVMAEEIIAEPEAEAAAPAAEAEASAIEAGDAAAAAGAGGAGAAAGAVVLGAAALAANATEDKAGEAEAAVETGAEAAAEAPIAAAGAAAVAASAAAEEVGEPEVAAASAAATDTATEVAAEAEAPALEAAAEAGAGVDAATAAAAAGVAAAAETAHGEGEVLPEDLPPVEIPPLDIATPLETPAVTPPTVEAAAPGIAAAAAVASVELSDDELSEPPSLRAEAAEAGVPATELPPGFADLPPIEMPPAQGAPQVDAAAQPPAAPAADDPEVLRAQVADLQARLTQMQSTTKPAVEFEAGDLADLDAAAAVSAAAALPGTDEVARVAAENRAAEASRAPAQPDDLLKIQGIGPYYVQRLKDAGITTYDGVIAASDETLAKVTGTFVDRVQREDWRGQAKRLAGK
jgi:predicted flap endonuclease-1-like 5' DNA nuclease